MVHKIDTSDDYQWIYEEMPFKEDEKVILEVNGPFHYINTEEQGRFSSEVSLYEEWKFQKLCLYGIYRYNLISYIDWEEKNKFPREAEVFLKDKIYNPKMTYLV